LVGIFVHSVEIGVSCGGGAATALAALEAGVLWASR
jgi:hypothetical protein